MLDTLYAIIQIAFFALSVIGLKVFLQGQGKYAGRNDS